MIKGVTKSIIEIFPKIRSQVELLTRRAPDYLQRQKRSITLKILVSGAAGALITAASFLILYVFV